MRVAGLDPSTRCIGWADVYGETRSLRPTTGPDEPGRRLAEIAGLVRDVIRHWPPSPDLVVLEGYSIGSPHRHTLLTLGEVGGAIRLTLFELDVPYVIVPPASLKRFATGNGNAPKEAMLDAARAAGALPLNDDEADAYLLRRMGRAAHALEPMVTDYERDAVAALRW